MSCHRCQRSSPDVTLQPYAVHYGRKIDQKATSEMRPGNVISTTTVTTYEVCGHTSIELCSDCVRRHRWKWRLSGLALVIGGIVVMGTFGLSVPWLGALGLPVALIGLPVSAWSLGRGFGQRYAVGLVDHELRKPNGYTTFWGDKEYASLLRKQQ